MSVETWSLQWSPLQKIPTQAMPSPWNENDATRKWNHNLTRYLLGQRTGVISTDEDSIYAKPHLWKIDHWRTCTADQYEWTTSHLEYQKQHLKTEPKNALAVRNSRVQMESPTPNANVEKCTACEKCHQRATAPTRKSTNEKQHEWAREQLCDRLAQPPTARAECQLLHRRRQVVYLQGIQLCTISNGIHKWPLF